MSGQNPNKNGSQKPLKICLLAIITLTEGLWRPGAQDLARRYTMFISCWQHLEFIVYYPPTTPGQWPPIRRRPSPSRAFFQRLILLYIIPGPSRPSTSSLAGYNPNLSQGIRYSPSTPPESSGIPSFHSLHSLLPFGPIKMLTLSLSRIFRTHLEAPYISELST